VLRQDSCIVQELCISDGICLLVDIFYSRNRWVIIFLLRQVIVSFPPYGVVTIINKKNKRWSLIDI
jgi:NAD-dependent dihydropyrimidine dehydrogenase PreA subunit